MLLVEGSSPRWGHSHPPPTTKRVPPSGGSHTRRTRGTRASPERPGSPRAGTGRRPSRRRGQSRGVGRSRLSGGTAAQPRRPGVRVRGGGKGVPGTRQASAHACTHRPPHVVPAGPASGRGARPGPGCREAVPALCPGSQPLPRTRRPRGWRRGQGRDGSGGLRGTRGRLELCPLRCLPPPDPHVSLHATEDGRQAAGLPRALQPPASHLQPGSQ